jgi:hypothetical protein
MTDTFLRHRLPRRADAASRDQNYIFGYGSLIERASRISTAPHAQVAFPVSVKGIQRGWFDQMPDAHPGLTPTYLGAVEDAEASTNGVVYAVTEAELAAYIERETGYVATEIEPDRFTFYDGRRAAPDARFHYFATKDPKAPNEEHPIVQSYVDIVMTGAMQQEANYPLAQEAGFVEDLVTGTSDWSPHWVNDRVFPYRPFISIPKAYDIDGVLTAHFPDFYPGRKGGG